MPNQTFNIIGISGSLRADSYNSAALRVARDIAPAHMHIETVEIGAFPLFNADVMADGLPEVVPVAAQKIKDADAVLIASPEYNYSVPGVLKNAIDWISRAPDKPFDWKPVAIMGASPGLTGTARMQYHLRQTFVFLNALVVNKPEVMINQAHQKFDKSGQLTDDNTRSKILDLLTALEALSQKLQ